MKPSGKSCCLYGGNFKTAFIPFFWIGRDKWVGVDLSDGLRSILAMISQPASEQDGTVLDSSQLPSCRWAEGPVWFNEHSSLVWSDIPNQRLLRWIEGEGVSVFRDQSNFANGNTRDRQGRITRTDGQKIQYHLS